MIVEQGIRNRNYQISKESILREITEAITLEEYHDAVQIIKDHINSKIMQRQLDLEAFQVYLIENNQIEEQAMSSPTSGKTAKINANLARIKLKWDSLSERERNEFV